MSTSAEDREWYYADDIPPQCPVCGSERVTHLGTLGSVSWFRCDDCGMDLDCCVSPDVAWGREGETDLDEELPETW